MLYLFPAALLTAGLALLVRGVRLQRWLSSFHRRAQRAAGVVSDTESAAGWGCVGGAVFLIALGALAFIAVGWVREIAESFDRGPGSTLPLREPLGSHDPSSSYGRSTIRRR